MTRRGDGAYDFSLTVNGVTVGLMLDDDPDSGFKVWREGPAPMLSPQFRTSGFGNEYVPPEIDLPFAFSDWGHGAGYTNALVEGETAGLSVAFRYSHSRGIDFSWGTRGYLSPAAQTPTQTDGTDLVSAVGTLRVNSKGTWALAGRYIYKFDVSSGEWLEKWDAGSGVTFTSLVEMDDVLYAAFGTNYLYSTDGGTDWVTSTLNETPKLFAVRTNVLWLMDADGVARNADDATNAGSWSAGVAFGHTSETFNSFLVADDLLFAFTDRAIYKSDGSTVDEVYTTGYVLDSNGKHAVRAGDGFIYVPYNNELLGFDPLGDTDFGIAYPPAGDGAEIVGEIVGVTYSGHVMYLAVKNAAGVTYLMKGSPSQRIWHTWAMTAGSLLLLRTPDTWTDDNAVGTITWGTTTKVLVSDNTYATAAAGTSHYLKGLNLLSAIPTDATIKGIKVTREGQAVTASASTGATAPGTQASDSSEGTDAWTNTGNVAASDDSDASIGSAVSTPTELLKLTNFGLAVPTTATIVGIECKIERAGGTGGSGTPTIVHEATSNIFDASTGASSGVARPGATSTTRLYLLTVQTEDAVTITEPSGWTVLATASGFLFAYRLGDGGDSTFTCTFSSSTSASFVCDAYSNVNQADPIGKLSSAATGSSPTMSVLSYGTGDLGDSFAYAVFGLDHSGGAGVNWSSPTAGWSFQGTYNGGGNSESVVTFGKVMSGAAADPSGFSVTHDVAGAWRGYMVEIQSGGITDEKVRLLDSAGAQTGDNKADTSSAWPTTDAVATYGSSSDLWGATWTPANVNDSDFGVVIQADPLNDDPTIDHVTLNVYYTDRDIVDNVVKLVKAGSVVGDNKATAEQWSADADATVTYGADGDLWGTTWTPAQINAATFGVVLSVTNTAGTAKVDHIDVTVYYTREGVAGTVTGILFTGAGKVHSTNPALVVGIGTRGDYYIEARDGFDPSTDPNYRFESSGVAFGPWIGFGPVNVPKFLNGGDVTGVAITAGRPITLGYELGDGEVETTLVTAQTTGVTSTNPTTRVPFNRMRYVLRMVTGDVGASPELSSLVLHATSNPDRKQQWRPRIVVANDLLLRNGARDPQTAAFIRRRLRKAPTADVQLTDREGNVYNVRVLDAQVLGLARRDIGGTNRDVPIMELVIVEVSQTTFADSEALVWGRGKYDTGKVWK